MKTTRSECRSRTFAPLSSSLSIPLGDRPAVDGVYIIGPSRSRDCHTCVLIRQSGLLAAGHDIFRCTVHHKRMHAILGQCLDSPDIACFALYTFGKLIRGTFRAAKVEFTLAPITTHTFTKI